MLRFTCIVLLIIQASGVPAVQPYYDIVVATDGTGDYTTITEAINALPVFNYERTVIFIRNGIYDEKIRIEQDNLTLLGENRDSTIIRYSQLRTGWDNNRDYIGPAVVNIHADDIILQNLTIENTQPDVGPHAFAVYGTGTRTILLNCNTLSRGADTVALWNYKTGMYYHSNCCFQGSVDFVCPRGYCYIRDSRFYELKETAAIWHAGAADRIQKFVICNSHFDGTKGFILGRHHYDAQFYLVNCSFSENMADVPIYRVLYEKEPEKNQPRIFGDRYYFYNCRRAGGNFEWFADNLQDADNSPGPEDITPVWTFNGQWDPESKEEPYVKSFLIEDKSLILYFNEPLTIRGNLTLTTHTGKVLRFETGRGRDAVKFISKDNLTENDFNEPVIISAGSIVVTEASVYERMLNREIDLNMAPPSTY